DQPPAPARRRRQPAAAARGRHRGGGPGERALHRGAGADRARLARRGVSAAGTGFYLLVREGGKVPRCAGRPACGCRGRAAPGRRGASMTTGDTLVRGRESFGRWAWADAFDQLSAADREVRLAPEDLERLAIAAYLVGRDADRDDVLARAHQEWLRLG